MAVAVIWRAPRTSADRLTVARIVAAVDALPGTTWTGPARADGAGTIARPMRVDDPSVTVAALQRAADAAAEGYLVAVNAEGTDGRTEWTLLVQPVALASADALRAAWTRMAPWLAVVVPGTVVRAPAGPAVEVVPPGGASTEARALLATWTLACSSLGPAARVRAVGPGTGPSEPLRVLRGPAWRRVLARPARPVARTAPMPEGVRLVLDALCVGPATLTDAAGMVAGIARATTDSGRQWGAAAVAGLRASRPALFGDWSVSK